MANNYTDKILKSIDDNPELLNQLLNSESEVTRSGQRSNPIINIVGNDISNDELNVVSHELSQNPVVQLYLASSGSLDAKDLVNYVGGVSGSRAPANNKAVRALFNGKLDLNEILILIVLLKLFKRKNSNTYNNSAIGLLGSLLGYNTNYNSGLFGGLGGNNYSNGLFGNSYSNGLFGNSYSSGLFGNTYNTSSGLGNFLGLTGNSNINNSSLSNLMNFVNGNYNNNSQYHTLYNILNQAAGTAVNSNGIVSANGLFSVLNQMMGY